MALLREIEFHPPEEFERKPGSAYRGDDWD